MAVMNRKLFADRQARNTLRNMGGIMASYPELMQEANEVQKFQDGSLVTAPFVSSVRPSEELLRQAEEVLTSPVPTFDVGPSGELTPEGRARTRQITVGTMPYLFDPGTGRVFRMDGSPVTEQEQARASEIIGSSPEIQAQIEAPELATQNLFEGQARRALRDYERAVESGSPAGVERARERLEEAQDRLTSPRPPFRPAETEDTMPDREATEPPVRSMTEEEVAEVADQMEAEAETTADDVVRVPNQPPSIPENLLPNPDETQDDLRSRYEDRLKLFQEVLGGANEQTAQDKAMQLAMIGLAIAAGQSPDALTNIAQGALTGLSAMSEQEAARRAQDAELRSAALESVLEEANRGAITEEDISDYYARLYEAGISDAPSAGITDPLGAAEYADNLARQGVFDRFGIRMPSRGAATTDLSASPQQLEDAARAAGQTEFVYNGMRYPVRPR